MESYIIGGVILFIVLFITFRMISKAPESRSKRSKDIHKMMSSLGIEQNPPDMEEKSHLKELYDICFAKAEKDFNIRLHDPHQFPNHETEQLTLCRNRLVSGVNDEYQRHIEERASYRMELPFFLVKNGNDIKTFEIKFNKGDFEKAEELQR